MSASRIGTARSLRWPGRAARLWRRAGLLLVFLPIVAAAIPSKSTSAAPPAPDACLPLEPTGEAVREIAGGTTHCYRVVLAEGEYLEAVVDQEAVDVVVAMIGPDGREGVQADGPGLFGPEPLWYVAASAGEHRLEVRVPNPANPQGRYRLRVLARRAASTRDLRLAEALAAHAQAEARRAAQTAADLDAAMVLYEKSLGLWREAEAPGGEARTLFSMGLVWYQRGDSTRATECLERAGTLAARAGDPNLQGYALQSLGDGYRRLGEAPKALECFDRAAALFHETGNVPAEGSILGSQGHVDLALGEPQQALDAFRRARELARRFGSGVEEATRLNDVAFVYSELGDLDRAQALYDEALVLFRAWPDSLNQAITLSNVGRLHRLRGDPARALEFLERSLRVRRELGDVYGEGWTLSSMGDAMADLGDAARALGYYRQAMECRRASADRQGEAATLGRIGALLARAGDRDAALASLRQALAIREAIRHRRGEADTRYGIARVLRDQGRLEESRDEVAAAVGIIESLRASVDSLELRASFLGSVQDYYELQVDVLMRMHAADPSKGLEARALEASESARARSLVDLLAGAGADVREGVDPALLLRERSLRQRLVAKLNRQVRLLAGKPLPPEAGRLSDELADLSTAHEAVLGEIRAKSPRYASLTQPRTLTVPEMRALLDGETLLVEYALGEERSHAWVVSEQQVWSSELPARSDIESAAREVSRGLEERPGPSDTGGAAVAESVRRLSELVLTPLAGHLRKRRLVFVGDGALHLVPLGLLTVQGRPLLADHELVNLPSASTLAVLRQAVAGRKTAAGTLAVVADPVFEKNDPRVLQTRAAVGQASGAAPSEATARLSRSVGEVPSDGRLRLPRLVFSRREAMDILALVPPRERLALLDFRASRDAVLGPTLSRYRIVHFATHGILDGVHPERSGIVLSLVDARGREREGFLSTVDVFNLRLNAGLLVLSACRSALGKPVRGEGLVSLSRAFMYAGAPTIVASLWQVDDEATAELMRHFYRGLLGPRHLSPAAALRAAQLRMREGRRWAHPHCWAGFVVQGDWR